VVPVARFPLPVFHFFVDTLAAVDILEQVPLAPLTTLGIGGPARYFVEARSADDVREALAFAREQELELFVLGGGSNLVVADEGFDGLVLKIAITDVDERRLDGKQIVDSGAGLDWDALVGHAVGSGAAGIECLSGIPGTVGGTPVQNVGAYGQEVSETISAVEAVDIVSGDVATFGNYECGFAYRTSRFNTTERGRWIILRVSFALTPGGAPKIAYADLKKAFPNGNASLSQVRETVIAIRSTKGMVLNANDPDSRSAGSFFKNPIVTAEQYADVHRRAEARGLTVPSYPALEAHHKIPAAWLIEQSGFPRGYPMGRVGVSSKHTLALVNRGDATAAELIALKNTIQAAVREQFGVELTPEPVFVGFASSESV
jgi:UDP-N-acetylmuramate dehydrogenase